ncbi:MAG: hypothetical protein QMC98_00525 [Candidatus Thermoplasmatota archaeon]|nr:hypothetical protein [Candidatus Thermoplasmatota archaeon]
MFGNKVGSIIILLLICLISSNTTSWVYTQEDLPSIDLSSTNKLIANFNYTAGRFETDYSHQQLLGIIALLSVANNTKNYSYLELAEKVWYYCENFYDGHNRAYRYNISNYTFYIIDNSYGILANLELYRIVGKIKYLERAKNIGNFILNNQPSDYFNISNLNSSIDLNTQALASIALLELYKETKTQSYLAALKALNATKRDYFKHKGYRTELNNTSVYYGGHNAKLAVANAKAYELTNITEFKILALDIVDFLISNLTFAQARGFLLAYAGIEKNGFFELKPYFASSETQLWFCIALSSLYKLTNNNSYSDYAKSVILATLLPYEQYYLRFWDFENGGYLDLNSNFIAVLLTRSEYKTDPKDAYTAMSLTLPKSKFCSYYSGYYSTYGIFNFTILSESNINKVIVEDVSKLGAYPIKLYHQSFSPAVFDSKGMAIECILENKYLIFNANLSSGYNNFTLYTSIPLLFLNASMNATFASINFIAFNHDIFLNQTIISFEATNIGLKKLFCDNKSLEFEYNYSTSVLAISNITFTGNSTLILEYEDKEKPRIANLSFSAHKVEKGIDIYVICEVTDNNVLENVIIYYNDASGWQSKSMLYVGESKYQAYLGSFENSVGVYVEAGDISGNRATTEIVYLHAEPQKEPQILYLIVLCIVIIFVIAVIAMRSKRAKIK